jgi:hypothetical protein
MNIFLQLVLKSDVHPGDNGVLSVPCRGTPTN